MIVHPCTQGTEEWRRLRLGVPTASQFHRIYAPKKRQPSKQRDLYLLELVDEWLSGLRDEPIETDWTRRGRELEPVARFDYSMVRNVAVQEVGFVTRDDGRVGGSPDGLVGDDVVLEIKCKSPHIHDKIIHGKDPGHIAQTQGLLYICERSIAHLYCYDPRGESVLKVIERDDEWIAGFVPVLEEFLADLEQEKHSCRGAKL